MKPFFRDNMGMGNAKQELFFETRFLISLIKNQMLTFTASFYSINKFNYFLSHSPSFSASNKSSSSPFKTVHSSGLYPAVYSLETKHDPQYS
jgi:hypothetical protein